jgi:hypothetical protein
MAKTLTAIQKYLAALTGKFRRALVRAVQAISKSGEPVAHSAVFPVASGFSFPTAFTVKEFPGLLFCHIVRVSSGDRVVTCWRDEPHFRAYFGVFQTKAGVPAAPDFDGPSIDIKYRETPWWKLWAKLGEYSPKEWIIGLLAIVGAVLGLRDYFAVFFASPEISMSYTDDAHTSVVEGAQFVVPLTVRSEVRFVPSYVSFVRHQLQSPSSPARPLTVSRIILPNLAAGVSETVNLSGIAPGFSRKQSAPDVYHISARAQGKAGLARSKMPFDSPDHDLWVWPSTPLVSPPKEAEAAGQICRFSGKAYISKPEPQGLQAEFIAQGPVAELDHMNVTAATNSTQQSFEAHTPSTRTLKVEFRTPPFEKFEEYHYDILLYSAGTVTKTSCEKLISGIEVTLDEPTL